MAKKEKSFAGADLRPDNPFKKKKKKKGSLKNRPFQLQEIITFRNGKRYIVRPSDSLR